MAEGAGDDGSAGGIYEGDEDPWAVWARAVIRVSPAGPVEVAGPAAVAVDGLPWGGRVAHVLTGWNPGREASAEENRAANERLAADLAAVAGAEVYGATGSDPEGTWSEPGFAVVGLSRAEALELGRRYGQMAVYELEGDALRVLASDGSRVLEVPRRSGPEQA